MLVSEKPLSGPSRDSTTCPVAALIVNRHLVRQHDVDGYVPKPFHIRDLMDRIGQVTRPDMTGRWRSPGHLRRRLME
jgi:DNA-binding response OmpR family regulator